MALTHRHLHLCAATRAQLRRLRQQVDIEREMVGCNARIKLILNAKCIIAVGG